MLKPRDVNLGEFGISVQNGFLPAQAPLKQLQSDYYRPWEDIVQALPFLLQTGRLRTEVDLLPVLCVNRLSSEEEWRRAYLLLSFITHAYIWGGETASQKLPLMVSTPFLQISSHFGLPPTATYSALNLWNFSSSSPDGDFSKLEHLSSLHTFTGTIDEEWFYLISVAMEARGGKVISIILRAMTAASTDDAEVLTECLFELATLIEEIGRILARMHEKCSPDIFYHQIRPFLAGSKNMASAGLPNGVFYENSPGHGEWRQYNGGSNAQSSLIQLLDVALGVEHFPTRGTGNKVARKSSFLQEMREYMPLGHRRFLQHIETVADIRHFVLMLGVDHPTNEAYNLAIRNLASFRDIHIQIVARYIIAPSKRSSTSGLAGTGGTELVPFLKQSRNETRETAACSRNCTALC